MKFFNKKLFILSSLIFCLRLYADAPPSYDLVNLNDKSVRLGDSSREYLENKKCRESFRHDKNEGLIWSYQCEMNSAVPNTEALFKVEHSPSNPLPQSLLERLNLNFSEHFLKQKYSCLFGFELENDNITMYQIKTKRKSLNGDDVGRTHASKLSVNCVTEDGLQSTFSYNTTLYSIPDLSSQSKQNGFTNLDQKFLNENIFQYFIDNIKKNNVQYWRLGVGFVNLSNQNSLGIFEASGQQQWWHHFSNSQLHKNLKVYNYVEAPNNRWGLLVSVFKGLQGSRNLGSSFFVNYSLEAGLQGSSLVEYNKAMLNSTLSLDLKPSSKFIFSIFAKSHAETNVERTTVVENSVGASLKILKCRLDLSGTKQMGQLNEYDIPSVNINKKGQRDLIYKLGLFCGTDF